MGDDERAIRELVETWMSASEAFATFHRHRPPRPRLCFMVPELLSGVRRS